MCDDEWENIDTEPDGMTIEELRAAAAHRLAERGPIIAKEHPPSSDETVEIERIP